MAFLMAVDEIDVDRERELIAVAEDLGGSIQHVQELAAPGGLMCHEAMFMTQIIERQIGAELLTHPAILSNPKWYIKVRQTMISLGELYQEIANEHMQELGIPVEDDF